MEKLSIAERRLKSARDSFDRQYEAQIAALTIKRNALKERLDKLNEKKLKVAKASGNKDAADDDLIEVNAGGRIVAAKRSTLTQLKGTRFEALFSGRWDKEVQRDSHGRIFLDVNPVCFQAIVDYLSEMAISSEDNPPGPPGVDDERWQILQRQLKLFGLTNDTMVEMPDSNITNIEGHIAQLHNWLKEEDSDGEFRLLYRSSRDGTGAAAFHSKCDDQGSTLTLIEATDGTNDFLFGGYSTTPWTSAGGYCGANKAFLFVLPGRSITAPVKMKLKNANDTNAVYGGSDYGPSFGDGDLEVHRSGSRVYFGHSVTYESVPLQFGNGHSRTTLLTKEIEVFQVSGSPPCANIPTAKAKKRPAHMQKAKPVTIFSEALNEAINEKQESLLEAELEVLHLENSFNDEHQFVSAFASGRTEDVIMLNVNGTAMAAKRSTLQAIGDSVLAQQFDDSKWTEQGSSPRVKDWAPMDVGTWMDNIEGVPSEVAKIFWENDINGRELLVLGVAGLEKIGVKRAGTVFLITDEIKKLKKASSDVVTLIEHSPYCFGKILDHLRLKQLHSQGLAEEPALPKVCDLQKGRFEKVVKYYFPGDSSKLILG